MENTQIIVPPFPKKKEERQRVFSAFPFLFSRSRAIGGSPAFYDSLASFFRYCVGVQFRYFLNTR